MPPTPDQIGVLIPGCIARGDAISESSPRAHKAAWRPKNYGAEEVSDAHRVIDHWNEMFRGVDGAAAAQKGNQTNVRAYVRMIRRCGTEGSIFASVSAATVIAAINAYRKDPGCRKIGRWKRFRDFCDPEIILQYAGQSKVAEHSAAQPQRIKREMDATAQKAKKVIDHRSFVYWIKTAAQSKRFTLQQMIDQQRKPGTELDRFFSRLKELLDLREMLSGPDRGKLLQRARNVFDAYHHRVPSSDADRAEISGIEVSLLDLDKVGWKFA